MTQQPDDANPDDPRDGRSPGSPSGGGRKLDEDAAWRAIVENYGDRPALDDDPPAEALGVEPPPPVEPVGAPDRDSHDTEATWENDGHFVPPDPPPMPPVSPRRKLAWLGLFGSPLLMLVAIVFGWSYPDPVMGLLLVGFVGGFGYLVATMPRNRPDGWSGDDGAVV